MVVRHGNCAGRQYLASELMRLRNNNGKKNSAEETTTPTSAKHLYQENHPSHPQKEKPTDRHPNEMTPTNGSVASFSVIW